ncbi:hypothetical protein QTP86_017021, partial [Hemibagrus guttatus]
MGGRGSLMHLGSEGWPVWSDPTDELLLLKLLKKLRLVNADPCAPPKGVDSASKFPRSQSNPAFVGCAGQTGPIHGAPTSQLTGLKGSAANILVPDPTAHLQGSSEVYASTGQGWFGSKR